MPEPLAIVSWRLSPWFGAALTPPRTFEWPSDWKTSTSDWQPFALACLQVLRGKELTRKDVSFGGWYWRNDAPLRYTVLTDPPVRERWKQMETSALKEAWHPAMACSLLRRALLDPLELMTAAFPNKTEGADRAWRLPASWLKRAAPWTAQRLIALGVARASDFIPRAKELVEKATPGQARQWIRAGVLTPVDLVSRRAEWLENATSSMMMSLLAAGICTEDELVEPIDRFVARAGISEAIAAVEAGLCPPDRFRSRIPSLIASANPHTARDLMAAGLCTREDFSDKKNALIALGSAEQAHRWIAAGIFTPADLESLLAAKPDGGTFDAANLADEHKRNEIEVALRGRVIEAEVVIARKRLLFLAHPDFPSNIYFLLDPDAPKTARLAVGDRVTCGVTVKLNEKHQTWGYVATDVQAKPRGP
jgi:hypothetical protein